MKKFLYLFIIFLILPVKTYAFSEEIDNWKVYSSEKIIHSGKRSCFYSYNSNGYVMHFEYGIGEVSGIMVTHPSFLSIPLPPNVMFEMQLNIDNNYLSPVSVSSMGNGSILIMLSTTEEIKNLLLESSTLVLLFSGMPIFEVTLPADKTNVSGLAAKCFEQINNRTLTTIQDELKFESGGLVEINKEREMYAQSVFNNVIIPDRFTKHERGIKASTDNSYWNYMVVQLPRIVPPATLKDVIVSKYKFSACNVISIETTYEDNTGYVISYGLECSDADKPYFLLGYMVMRAESNETIDVFTIVYEDNLLATLDDLKEVLRNIKSSFGIDV